MYCSLKEAYNIPSFDPASGKKKKTCMNPLSQQALRQPGGAPLTAQSGAQQAAQQCTISIDDLDAYNEFLRMKEYAAAKTQYTREDFTTQDTSAWSTNRDQPGPYFDTTTPYSTQGMDYKYYCDNYKICPKAPINSVEHFDNTPMAPSGSTATADASTAASTAASAGQALPPKQCNPIQAPVYEIPISDAAKEEYSEAMNVSLNQESPNYPAPVPQARVYDMNKVTGYYDEDLEQYLKTNNLNVATSGSDKTPIGNAVNKYKDKQLGIPTGSIRSNSKTLNDQSTEDIIRPYSNNRENTDGTGTGGNNKYQGSDNLKKIDYILDITLFILIGILVILLCDQIFKVAMVYGMHETMRMLNPYLQQSQQSQQV